MTFLYCYAFLGLLGLVMLTFTCSVSFTMNVEAVAMRLWGQPSLWMCRLVDSVKPFTSNL